MQSNGEGFDEPVIELSQCTHCKSCEKVCPLLAAVPVPQAAPLAPLAVYACWNQDKTVRRLSSSGGLFSTLADYVLSQNGVVFGCYWDKDTVARHGFAAENSSGAVDLPKLRTSKYVQSSIGNALKDVKTFLEDGRKVLFTGTPCQVAGLYSFLGKAPDNLITADTSCHGAASPKVFARFVQHLEQCAGKKIVSFNHRCKKIHWEQPCAEVVFDDGTKKYMPTPNDPYIVGFGRAIYLRESCHHCRFCSTRRVGDFTIADFWRIGEIVPFNHPVRDGVSLLLVNQPKAADVFDAVKSGLFFEERTLQEAVNGQARFRKPVGKHPQRENFFRDWENLTWQQLADKYLRTSLDARIKSRLKLFVKQMLGN
ncbi:F420H2-dehydrogenase subunit [Planctomycetales bacterium]|nr:F420H2-dehydrogenase subunit [Planctomycetales bacterium]